MCLFLTITCLEYVKIDGSFAVKALIEIEWQQYERFGRDLPSASKKLKLDADKLTYADLCRAMESWLKDNA